VNETLARERAELADQLAAMLARERAELADLLDNLPDIDLDVLVAAYWQKPDLFDALLEAIRESRD